MKNPVKKMILTILFFSPILLFSQSYKSFNSGVIYWGSFDADTMKPVDGSLEKYADLIQLKMVDNDYYIYARDKQSKKIRFKFSKTVSSEDSFSKYLDEDGNSYYIFDQSKGLSIISLKKLPNMKNKHMMLVIAVE
ncbi:hypothetical protein [Elizabethkingia meningoseptica]|uniref:hypothetical protein n=1 Tax=Elizabethkingia meningoseptica TaxID=238 RepID=UPI000841A912|nr:hypothetical protein [Elizabethkingia meningoseptica]ODM55190.1 hypothetical protein BES09_01680 [Elizabethkingia meningoseptica]OHT30395.1 hypothetical protein BFF93_01685 [Elizabethkingia meningoseptica]OPC12131.1 hypothetical protein BAX93_06470 [Elizabethkingia meningoseptica]